MAQGQHRCDGRREDGKGREGPQAQVGREPGRPRDVEVAHARAREAQPAEIERLRGEQREGNDRRDHGPGRDADIGRSGFDQRQHGGLADRPGHAQDEQRPAGGIHLAPAGGECQRQVAPPHGTDRAGDHRAPQPGNEKDAADHQHRQGRTVAGFAGQAGGDKQDHQQDGRPWGLVDRHVRQPCAVERGALLQVPCRVAPHHRCVQPAEHEVDEHVAPQGPPQLLGTSGESEAPARHRVILASRAPSRPSGLLANPLHVDSHATPRIAQSPDG
jgi:hypothetical protein